jgi:zinc transport system permease protein
MTELQLELFWQPYLTGALLAILLPLLGLYLRLRGEYWAALAYGQIGAAGALGALVSGFSSVLGGLAASLAAASLKHGLERRLPSAGLFPLLFLSGWGVSLLLTANLPAVERLGQALFEGQLYFVSRDMLYGALFALLSGVGYVRYQGRALLLLSLHPALFQARGIPAWPVRIGFDLIVAASLALAVMCLGVMGAFALVFVPPWLMFALAPGWRFALIAAPLLAFLAYSLAFALALYGDQPFGPALALVLTALAVVRYGGYRKPFTIF